MDGIRTFLNRENNPNHWSPDSISTDLSHLVIVVTGGNAGIGFYTVLALAKHSPKCIFLTARTKAKYESAMEKIRQEVPNADDFVKFLELDLASLASAKQASEVLINSTDRLDILINNAGIMGAPPDLTPEGYEIHFGTNHVGHALFTKLLMPLLLRTAEQPNADVRVINVSSLGYTGAPAAGFDPALVATDMSGNIMMTRYGQSKMANILHARELANRYPAITTVSLHPGRVGTGLLDNMFSSDREWGFVLFQKFYDRVVCPTTPERGAWNQIWCATVPKEELKTASFYVPVGALHAGNSKCRDDGLARKLWDWQESEFARLGYA